MSVCARPRIWFSSCLPLHAAIGFVQFFLKSHNYKGKNYGDVFWGSSITGSRPSCESGVSFLFWKWLFPGGHVAILIAHTTSRALQFFVGMLYFSTGGRQACGNIDSCCLSVVTNDFQELWPETLISKHFDFLCSQPCTAAVTFCKKNEKHKQEWRKITSKFW